MEPDTRATGGASCTAALYTSPLGPILGGMAAVTRVRGMDGYAVSPDVRELAERSRPVALIAGVLAIVWAVVLIAWPGPTVKVGAVLVGIAFLIGGTFELASAISSRGAHSHWVLHLLKGLVDVGIGLVSIMWPSVTVGVVVILIAIDLIFTGVMGIILSRQVPDGYEERHHYLWRGILSIALGMVVAVWPEATIRVVLFLIGLWSLLAGVLLLLAWHELGKIEKSEAA